MKPPWTLWACHAEEEERQPQPPWRPVAQK